MEIAIEDIMKVKLFMDKVSGLMSDYTEKIVKDEFKETYIIVYNTLHPLTPITLETLK